MILKDAKILPSWGYNCRVALAKVRVLDNPRNLNLNELTACFENHSFKVNRGYIARNIGEVLLTIGKENITNAESWIQKAIENDHKYNVRWSLANDYAAFGKLLLLKGDQSEAKETFDKAIGTFKECGADGWVEQYKKEFAEL
jgi:tetratricopeptide (TPR) repeat protein